MLKRVTITRVDRREVNTVKGPAQKVGIQTREHGEKWLGTFVNQYNSKQLEKLAEGQTVMIQEEQSGQYLNFRIASAGDLLKARVDAIEAHLGISNPFAPISPATRPAALPPKPAPVGQDFSDFEPNPEDIPF